MEASAPGEGGRPGGVPDGGEFAPHGREIAVLREKAGKKTRKTRTSLRKSNLGEKQPLFFKDIHLGPKHGSLEQIQITEARTRVRVDHPKHARKVKLDEKGNNEKLNLTFRMMLGVRVAVGRMANPFLKLDDLNQHDFAQEDRYVFPPAGANGRLATPSHKLNMTFKFRDYAPKVFKKLRGIFGIDEASYMNSVAGDYDYLELITNSKSGSFFFYSHDRRYIIKNMKKAEHDFFRKILPQYYEHHRTHPDSVLTRFCGMYLVKNGRKKIPFIVMKCIDGAAQTKMHAKYDLKGSAVHRTAFEGEKVLKDNNVRKAKTTFKLGSQRDAFLKVVRSDAEFLRSVEVMDYSMFITVHDTSRPPERGLQRDYSQFFHFADEASDGPRAPVSQIPSLRGAAIAAAAAGAGGAGAADGKEAKTAESAVEDATPASPSPQAGAIRYRKDGGIDSEGGDGAQEVYWLGVIDVLQVYTPAKHVETWIKGIGRVRSELSCVNPKLYCERFVGFMAEITR